MLIGSQFNLLCTYNYAEFPCCDSCFDHHLNIVTCMWYFRQMLASFPDPFQFDLCRYSCHAERWAAKLTDCGYTPPPIGEISPSSNRKMLWERVKSERERALVWWSDLPPTCYPVPEPPYTPPPPAGSIIKVKCQPADMWQDWYCELA